MSSGADGGGPRVVVVGAGPNGLTAAAYLSRAGCDVTVVEKNVETGGGLVTEEIAGFKLNLHATYMMLGEMMPPYRDLGLRDLGVDFIRPDAQVSFLFDDHRSFTLFTQLDRSVSSVEALSPTDGPRVRSLLDDCARICDAFVVPATYYPPLGPIEQVEALELAGGLGARMAEMGDMSPAELVGSYGIEDPRVEVGLLYLIAMFGLDPEEGGMGFLAPVYLHRLTQAALVRGGSHQFSSALRRSVEDAGGEVIVGAEVVGLLESGGRVTGVRLVDGTELLADAVLSTLNPHQNFLQLAGGLADEALTDAAHDWEWERSSLFVRHLGILGEPPRYEGYPKEVGQSLTVVMGYEDPGDLYEHMRSAEEGSTRKVAGHGTVASLFDPLLAPGHVPFGSPHTLRWECIAPYEVDWVAEQDGYAERCIDLWARYAPNIRDANVRVEMNWTPKDIEAHLQTMARGSIKHGAYTSIQMGYNRPNPDCSGYRTPIDGFYVGGASTHPGGMVILGSGYNAARAVAEDLGADIWWSEPAMVTAAREAGYFGREG